MKQLKKIMAVTVFITMSFVAVGCGGNETQSTSLNHTDNQIIAIVNGQPIRQSDYETLYNEYYKYFGETEEADTYLQEQKVLLVDELINTAVLMQKAEKLGITCTDEEATEALENIKSQYDEEAFKEMLEYSNITEKQYLDKIKKQLILLELQEGMIADEIEVTDQEVEAYYNQNQEEYTVGAGADISHILVQVKDESDEQEKAQVAAQVKEIESQLAQGISFEEIFKTYSDEVTDSSLSIAEELGFIEFDSPYIDKDFLAGVKTLKEGEVSNAVKSSFGYHFIKVEKMIQEHVIPLADIRSEIINILEEEKQYEMYRQQLEKWVIESEIERYEDRIQ